MTVHVGTWDALLSSLEMSQSELAQATGLSLTSVNGYVLGLRRPRGEALQRLATVARLSPEELYESLYGELLGKRSTSMKPMLGAKPVLVDRFKVLSLAVQLRQGTNGGSKEVVAIAQDFERYLAGP